MQELAARVAAPIDVLTSLASKAEEHAQRVAEAPVTPPSSIPHLTPAKLEAEEVRFEESQEDLRLGKPKTLSWCSWYQRVCRILGPAFDGKVISGEEALQQWKDMDGNARAHWMQAYSQFCDPEDAGQAISESKGTQPSGYECLQDRKPVHPVPDERVATVAAFEERWKALKNPSKSVQLARSKDWACAFVFRLTRVVTDEA